MDVKQGEWVGRGRERGGEGRVNRSKAVPLPKLWLPSMLQYQYSAPCTILLQLREMRGGGERDPVGLHKACDHWVLQGIERTAQSG